MALGSGLLPTGGSLSDDAFRRRHRTLRVVLLLHLPVLALLGWLRDEPSAHTAAAVAAVAVAALLSGLGDRRTRSLIVAAGLAASSAGVIALSDGAVQAHYHVLVMVGFVALYQDWPPFAGFLSLTAVGYAAAAALAPTQLFEAPESGRPYLWAGVHVAFAVAEAVAMAVFWRATEHEQERVTTLASDLTRAELDRTRAEDDQNRSSSELLSSLARRNQVLLDRQLQRIDALEQTERDPELLAELFSLDHLATRMRRNAESLLVLAGSGGNEAFDTSVPLSEICRGAMAEVEDYARVDIALVSDVLVNGAVVGDLVHRVAELIENATSFSPPTTRVMISGNVTSSRGYVLAVSDSGIGMADTELAAANLTLGDSEETGMGAGGMLGLRVVSRLAARYGIRAWLQRGQGSGLAAMLALPAETIDPSSAMAMPGGAPSAVFAGSSLHQAPELVGAVAGGHNAAAPVLGAGSVEAPSAPVYAAVATSVAAGVEASGVQASGVQPSGVQASGVEAPAAPAQPAAAQPAAAQPSPAAVAAPLTAAGLVKRVPKASLAPALREDGAAPAAAEPAITPDRARSVLSAFTGGVQRARHDVHMPQQGGPQQPAAEHSVPDPASDSEPA